MDDEVCKRSGARVRTSSTGNVSTKRGIKINIKHTCVMLEGRTELSLGIRHEKTQSKKRTTHNMK